MADTTVIILTRNEELNIKECIDSLKGFARRIIVVDSGSEDDTPTIARQMGAEVYFREFDTHARQFNWALDNIEITTPWIYRIDADERLTPELIAELDTLSSQHLDDDVTGISTEAWLHFCGGVIRHGCANKRRIVMFKTGIGRMEDRKIDEHTILSQGRVINARERFIHRDYKDMTHWINKMNWYAEREVDDYMEYLSGTSAEIQNDEYVQSTRKKKYGFYYKFPKFFRCFLLFFYYYIFKGGFLDGVPGFIFNFMYHLWFRSLIDTKIYERMNANE